MPGSQAPDETRHSASRFRYSRIHGTFGSASWIAPFWQGGDEDLGRAAAVGKAESRVCGGGVRIVHALAVVSAVFTGDAFIRRGNAKIPLASWREAVNSHLSDGSKSPDKYMYVLWDPILIAAW